MKLLLWFFTAFLVITIIHDWNDYIRDLGEYKKLMESKPEPRTGGGRAIERKNKNRILLEKQSEAKRAGKPRFTLRNTLWPLPIMLFLLIFYLIKTR